MFARCGSVIEIPKVTSLLKVLEFLLPKPNVDDEVPLDLGLLNVGPTLPSSASHACERRRTCSSKARVHNTGALRPKGAERLV